MATRTENILNSLTEFQLHHFHVTVGNNTSNSPTQDDVLVVELKQPSKPDQVESKLQSWVPVLDIVHANDDVERLASFISQEVRNVFADEAKSLSYILGNTPFATGKEANIFPEDRKGLEARTTRAFKYASSLHLTFSLFTSSATPSAWDIEEALEQYITPLLGQFSAVTKITVDTQVQLQASFSPSIEGPTFDAATGQWKLDNSDLGGFINAAEWPLSPSIGSGPTINLVLYVPSTQQSPLVIAETGGSSWLIPQWGGVQILNSKKLSGRLSAEDLKPIMLTFADQLTSLLGFPQSPPSLSLRISSLTRERATSLIMSASSTLGALSRLTLKLKSIAIPDTVAKSVDETIDRLNQACQDLKEGRFSSALQNARIAEDEAEQAFFEPSMVGQVYFPDEHRVAVYVPLLGPMAVPLVMAGAKELLAWVKYLKSPKTKTA